jgi:hypothetical protein
VGISVWQCCGVLQTLVKFKAIPCMYCEVTTLYINDNNGSSLKFSASAQFLKCLEKKSFKVELAQLKKMDVETGGMEDTQNYNFFGVQQTFFFFSCLG